MRLKITPAYARELLEDAHSSRSLRKLAVKTQSDAMRAGTWDPRKYTPVRIDVNGRLVAGQHELTAVTVYGQPVVMEVVQAP